MNMKLINYISTICKEDKPLKFLLAKILMRIKISSFLTIKRKEYRLRFYPSAYSRILWINNNYENPVLDFVHAYLREGDILVDVGANIGLVTVESSLIVGQKGKIYSFEPHPKVFNFLRGNILLNHLTNIETFNVALGNTHGNILFSDEISDDQNSIKNSGTGVNIPIRRLDELIDLPNVTLLKIDVEGYEKFVLIGAAKLLKITKCVFFEATEQAMRKYDYSIEDIYDIFISNKFQLFRINDKKEISPITKTYRPKTIGLSGEDLLAIRNIDDFLQRTGYTLITNKQQETP